MNVLIALVGKSPAVLTCTLDALVTQDPPFLPDAIVVITTTTGASELSSRLLNKRNAKDGQLVALCKKLKLPLALADATPQGALHVVVAGKNGKLADDAHSYDEMNQMGQQVFSTLHQYTRDSENRVMLSLSGGRKTMAHLAGTAMSMLGRPGKDDLLHVLVKPEWLEDCGNFYFPSCISATHQERLPEGSDADPESCKSSDAKTVLSRVPFIALSGVNLLKSAAAAAATDKDGFAKLIRRLNLALDSTQKIPLSLMFKTAQIEIDRNSLEFTKSRYRELAILRLVARNPGAVQSVLTPDQICELLIYWKDAINGSGRDAVNAEKGWHLVFNNAFYGAPPKTNTNIDPFQARRKATMAVKLRLLKPDQVLQTAAITIAKSLSDLNIALRAFFGNLREDTEVGLWRDSRSFWHLGTAFEYREV